MANTLTISSLSEIIFQARDTVASEPTGFLRSVLVNAGSEGVSLGGTVTSHTTAQPTLNTSYSPSMTIPAGDDQTVSAKTFTINQVANVRVPITGEAAKQLGNTAGYEAVMRDIWAQSFRTIRNAIEAHCGTVIKNGSSRATGTAGTTPFASNLNIITDLRKILIDNGCPEDDQWSLVLDTSAGTKLRQLTQLQKVNEAGTDELLRRAKLGYLSNFAVGESAGVASHTAGAATGQLIDNASTEAVGQTILTLDTITVNTTGIVAGDVITHAQDSVNKYVVNTGLVATAGDIVIGDPGLRIAANNNSAITIGAAYTANMGFHRNAVELVMRPPAQPYGGDAAVDRMTVFDDKSGLVFEVAQYKGYGMAMFDITCFYQAKVWKPNFVATLLG